MHNIDRMAADMDTVMDHKQIIDDHIYNIGKGYIYDLLLLSIGRGDIDFMNSLVFNVNDPVIQRGYAYELLEHAMASSNLSIDSKIQTIQYLLQYGPDLNSDSGNLMRRIQSDQDIEFAKLFVAAGANPNILHNLDRFGWTSVYELINPFDNMPTFGILKFYLENKIINIDDPINNDKHTPLAVAVMLNKCDLAQLFLEFGATINVKYQRWYHQTCRTKRSGQQVRGITTVNTKPQTILEYARESVISGIGSQDMVDLLDKYNIEDQTKGVHVDE